MKEVKATDAWSQPRGHWRTYKASGKRIWVRWCLVGSPLVGQVKKHYEM